MLPRDRENRHDPQTGGIELDGMVLAHGLGRNIQSQNVHGGRRRCRDAPVVSWMDAPRRTIVGQQGGSAKGRQRRNPRGQTDLTTQQEKGKKGDQFDI